jgi:hypothetical protein
MPENSLDCDIFGKTSDVSLLSRKENFCHTALGNFADDMIFPVCRFHLRYPRHQNEFGLE